MKKKQFLNETNMKNGTGGYWSNFDMIVAFLVTIITFIVNSKFHNYFC